MQRSHHLRALERTLYAGCLIFTALCGLEVESGDESVDFPPIVRLIKSSSDPTARTAVTSRVMVVPLIDFLIMYQ